MVKGRNSSVVRVRLPDELVTRLELLAGQRRKTMSVLLRDIIERYVTRWYSFGRPRRRVRGKAIGILSSVSVLSSAVSVRLPDELVTRLELLARQRRKTMSVLLRDIIERYAARRYSFGRPGCRVRGEAIGILSSMPVLSSARLVGVVGGDSLGLDVVPGGSEIKVVPPVSMEWPLELKGHYPCPCGSGKRYRDCCRP